MKILTRILVTVAVAGGVAIGAWLWHRSAAADVEEAPMATGAAERRDVAVVVEAAGVVEPVQVVEVKSNASGEVLAVSVETGDWIERGDLLAEIDPRDVQSAYDQAAADLESARVRLSTAQAAQGRAERLAEGGLIPEQDLDTTVETTAAARAALVRAQAAVRLAGEKLDDVTIRAPVAGTVIERGVEPGQIIASATSNVSGGTTLFRVADLSRMQVRANVDEVDVGQVTAGQAAEVSVESYPGRVFAGTVRKIEPLAVVEQNVTMFPVIVRLDNPEGVLKPGMNAEVTLQVASREDVVAVPNAAVVDVRQARATATALGVEPPAFGGGPRAGAAGGRPGVVFVQGPGGIEARRVGLGLTDWEYTEVLDGLQAGDRVVLVSVAELQRRQQEMTDRVRQRFGGPMGSGSGQNAGRPGAGGGRN
jgi:HlyD family secretion protein